MRRITKAFLTPATPHLYTTHECRTSACPRGKSTVLPAMAPAGAHKITPAVAGYPQDPARAQEPRVERGRWPSPLNGAPRLPPRRTERHEMVSGP